MKTLPSIDQIVDSVKGINSKVYNGIKTAGYASLATAFLVGASGSARAGEWCDNFNDGTIGSHWVDASTLDLPTVQENVVLLHFVWV